LCVGPDKVATVGAVSSPSQHRPPGGDPADVVDHADVVDQGTVDAALRAADVTAGLGRVRVVPSTASTSTDLLGLATSAPADWPDRSVLVADHQVAGRGRSGRSWTTPPGTALTFAVLLRPAAVDVSRLGWLPLLAGLAVVQAVGEVAGVHAVLKWPNDVLVVAPDEEVPGWGRYRKVAGVLGDLAVGSGGGGSAVVVGIGVNVSQTAAQLPVASASSLALAAGAGGAADLPGAGSLAGAAGTGMEPVRRAQLLAAVLDRLVALDGRWRRAGGDAWAAGLGAQVAAVCVTLGTAVQVELPGGGTLQGVATRLAADGALEVTDETGAPHTVHAGDVRHLRAAEPRAGDAP
jgi:BirA family biotin operon repressor/biotin-[acetyl-CoA-carboxylase] ligase